MNWLFSGLKYNYVVPVQIGFFLIFFYSIMALWIKISSRTVAGMELKYGDGSSEIAPEKVNALGKINQKTMPFSYIYIYINFWLIKIFFFLRVCSVNSKIFSQFFFFLCLQEYLHYRRLIYNKASFFQHEKKLGDLSIVKFMAQRKVFFLLQPSKYVCSLYI